MKLFTHHLFFFLLLTQILGCYTYQEITKEEFMDTKEFEDLQITTINQVTYQFDSEDYVVKNDSIYGNGKIVNLMLINRDYNDFTGSIYLKDISSYRIDKFNAPITIIFIATIVGLFYVMGQGLHI